VAGSGLFIAAQPSPVMAGCQGEPILDFLADLKREESNWTG
jgi:hypothetical protein